MSSNLLFISGEEILVIVFATFLLFGSKKLPEIARGLGKGLREIRKVTSQLQDNLNDTELGNEIKEIKKITNDIKKDIDKSINTL